jgi:putative ABC transport system permease protein
MLLAMAIGVAAVLLVASLGEGARVYVIDQFSSLGTNLFIVLPVQVMSWALWAALAVALSTGLLPG